MARSVKSDQSYMFLAWAGHRLGLSNRWPAESVALGIVDDPSGAIHAAVVYNAFYEDACHMHIATDGKRRWATRATLEKLFAFPFLTMGLARVNAEVRQSDVPTMTMALKLGFRIEGVKRRALDGEDAVILGMLRDECTHIAKLTNEQDASSAMLKENSRHGKEGRE